MNDNPAAPLPQIHAIGDVIVQAGFKLGPRTIGDFELVYFPDGTDTVYSLGDNEALLNEPCFILTRPGESHSYRFDPNRDVRHLFIHFEYEPMRNADPRFEMLLGYLPPLPSRHYSLAGGMMKKMVWIANRQPPHWRRRISVLISAVLEELAADDERYSSRELRSLPIPIQQAIVYMDEHLQEPITIEDIAGQSGWTHEHFTRVFASALGMTPRRMLLEKRLRRAEDMMLRGGGTVKQIAYSVGFRDEHHFSKMYKQARGMTASEYIRRCNSPLFRHTADSADPLSLFPVNRLVVFNDEDIK